MSSGVKCNDEVKNIINEMKVNKKDTDAQDRIRVVVLVINHEKGEIEVEKIFRQGDLEDGQDGFDCFQCNLDTGICRYILYDCHYETPECKDKEDLVFVAWCPDTCTIKQKMCYASSKNAIRPFIEGIKHEFQINEPSDCSRESMGEKLGKGCTKIEGRNIRGGGCGKKGGRGRDDSDD